MCFFFKQKTAYEMRISDWSSDVCSSDRWMREELSKYQSAAPCETCGGARLRSEPLAVKIAGEDISMSTRRSVRHAYAWFSTLEAKLTPQQQRSEARRVGTDCVRTCRSRWSPDH